MKIFYCVIISLFLILPLQAASFSKPQNASQLVKGKFGSYELWINPEDWTLVKDYSKENEEDLVFRLGKEFVFGNLRATPQHFKNIDELKNAYLDLVHSFMQNMHVLKKENRNVNGTDILYIQVSGKKDMLPAIFDAYLYLGDTFTVILSTMCEQSLRSKHQRSIMDFLNGLMVSP